MSSFNLDEIMRFLPNELLVRCVAYMEQGGNPAFLIHLVHLDTRGYRKGILHWSAWIKSPSDADAQKRFVVRIVMDHKEIFDSNDVNGTVREAFLSAERQWSRKSLLIAPESPEWVDSARFIGIQVFDRRRVRCNPETAAFMPFYGMVAGYIDATLRAQRAVDQFGDDRSIRARLLAGLQGRFEAFMVGWMKANFYR